MGFTPAKKRHDRLLATVRKNQLKLTAAGQLRAIVAEYGMPSEPSPSKDDVDCHGHLEYIINKNKRIRNAIILFDAKYEFVPGPRTIDPASSSSSGPCTIDPASSSSSGPRTIDAVTRNFPLAAWKKIMDFSEELRSA